MGIEAQKAYRLVVIAFVVGAVNWAVPHLAIVLSESVRYSVLWRVGGSIGKGDYVNVPLPEAFRRSGRPKWMTKRVGCVAGEILRVGNGGHYCDGEWMGAVLRFGSDGKALHPFVWDGPVPAGKVYLVGDSPLSYDSRYLGFFDQNEAVRLKGLL